MYYTERILASISILWTIIALLYQWSKARPGNHRDFSVRAGDPLQGIIYNFTWAMLPWRKETIRLHPYKFVVGVLMHIGVFVGIFKALILIINPNFGPLSPVVFGPIFGIAICCGLYLFFRRIFTPNMRYMSSPEDYFSVLVTVYFLIIALSHELGMMNSGLFLSGSSLVFIYIPLGKLRHALFFFIARAEYGSRLGYRGIYRSRMVVKE